MEPGARALRRLQRLAARLRAAARQAEPRPALARALCGRARRALRRLARELGDVGPPSPPPAANDSENADVSESDWLSDSSSDADESSTSPKPTPDPGERLSSLARDRPNAVDPVCDAESGRPADDDPSDDLDDAAKPAEEKKAYIKCANIANLLKPELLKKIEDGKVDAVPDKLAKPSPVRPLVLNKASRKQYDFGKKSHESAVKINKTESASAGPSLKLYRYPSTGDKLIKYLAKRRISKLHDSRGKVLIDLSVDLKETLIKTSDSESEVDKNVASASRRLERKAASKVNRNKSILISSESGSDDTLPSKNIEKRDSSRKRSANNSDGGRNSTDGRSKESARAARISSESDIDIKKSGRKERKLRQFSDSDNGDLEKSPASSESSTQNIVNKNERRRQKSSPSISSGSEIKFKRRKKRNLSSDSEESSDSPKKMGRSSRRDNNKKSKNDSVMKENKKSKKEDNLLDTLINGKNNLIDEDKDDDASSIDMMADKLKNVTGDPTREIISELLEDSSNNSEQLSITNGTDKKMDIKETNSVNSDDGSAKDKSKKNASNDVDSESDSAKNDIKGKSENNDVAADKETMLTCSDSAESEIFKPTKKKRKKKNASDEGSSDDKSSSENMNQKKRRRIKHISGDDSEGSGNGDNSDSDEEGESKKHGRKNIRKVKRSGNLDEATRTAARIERERVQRIAERQKLYNESMFDEFGRPDEVVKLDKIILDYDPKTKEPVITVDKGLVEKLKPHQGNGIKFMWDACFESVKQIKDTKGSGCILAHCMGLGKTLQVVTLVHTLLTHQELTKVERVLVVCPLSTVLNWVNEFKMWLKFAERKDLEIYELSKFKQNYERSNKLKEWLECGGVCVLGYDMFRNLSSDTNKKFRKAQLSAFQKSLVDPGPDLVVCDEGHLLKNEKTSLSQSMNRIKTLRRIVLTGTPLQNNLKEYYCMVQFVKPNLLGKYNEYLNRFVNPITNGQYTDSTEHDIRIMKRRSHVLHKMLDGAVQRRDYAVLAPFLPPKHEYVLFITLTDIQIKLYSFYMDNFSRRPQPDRKNTGFLFPDFQSLQRIWTHPLVLKANSERYEILQQKKRDKEEEDSEGSLADFIDDEDTTTPDETSSSDDNSDDMSDDSVRRDKKKKGKGKNSKPTKRVTRATVVDDDDDEVIEIKPEIVETRQDNPTEWWMSLCSEEELNDIHHSNKLILLLDILKMCDAIGDKLLVFSQSLYSLDLIEQFLWKIDEATQKGENEDNLGGHLGSWSPGIDYFRLDGSTSCENRAVWCKNFNKEDNPRARLFLISTRAGGLGINLVAANRVVIFDMSWNPSHDVQSIFRVYRFGQKKPCYVYRFLALGTMEEKIYERQVTKQAISKRVIDEQQIDRHYAESDLAELYTFCPVPEGPREVPKLPKDRLFADLIKQHDTMIYKYHEHDSLLENKEEETLTEEERKAAWEDYENEKTRPPTLGGQLLAGYHQQQQHNLAMSALLQQDYPGLTEQQIAGMVPALLQKMYQNGDTMLPQQMFNQGYDYNLMQKMNSMISAQNNLLGGFKYPQAQLMNPNLMLNPVSASAGSFNQSNWQQQQQIQLQRLQQQQAMQANLKYYAGGLGSRDTMDMAAMQQRQRAMMMATNSNIPQRGRPPKNQSLLNMAQMPLMQMKNPLGPPTTMSTDIVDLDSE